MVIEYLIDMVIWLKLCNVLFDYLDFCVELLVDYGLLNIVEECYDIGVWYGDQVVQDMIVVCISFDILMVMVVVLFYFDGCKLLKKLQDLFDYDCIMLWFVIVKSIYVWELKKGRNVIQVCVNGWIICNMQLYMVQVVFDGFGIVFVVEDVVYVYLCSGVLWIVMLDWCLVFFGYYVYYLSCCQVLCVFFVVIDVLWYWLQCIGMVFMWCLLLW